MRKSFSLEYGELPPRAKDINSFKTGDQGIEGRRHLYITLDEYQQALVKHPNLHCSNGGSVLRMTRHSEKFLTSGGTRNLKHSKCLISSEPTELKISFRDYSHSHPWRQRCAEFDRIDIEEGVNLLVWNNELRLAWKNTDTPLAFNHFRMEPADGDEWESYSFLGPAFEVTNNWPVWQISEWTVVRKSKGIDSLSVMARINLMKAARRRDGWETTISVLADYGHRPLNRVNVIELWMEKLVKPIWYKYDLINDFRPGYDLTLDPII